MTRASASSTTSAGRDQGTGSKVPVGARALATTVAALALTVAPAAAQDDRALLERYAPTLHYARGEMDRATAVEALTARVAGTTVTLRPRVRPLPDVVYGRVVPGRRFLQYWLLYADNPQDRGVVRTGRHEGDWELVQVELDTRSRAVGATYAQHSWAERCRGWSGDVYVARGSHASYPRPGVGDRPWPDPNDEALGDGVTVRPAVRPFGTWVRWPGRWGRTEAGWVPGESDSPRGPAFQAPWRNPAAFSSRARACGSGAPPLPWPVYAGVALAGVLAIVAITLKLRSRPPIT